jgi:hypothetical protein
MQKPWQQMYVRNGSSFQPKCPCGWVGRRVSVRARAEREADKHGPGCGWGDE